MIPHAVLSPTRRRGVLASLLTASSLALALTACGTNSGQASTPAPPAGPAISVVVSNFPIAQLVNGVGGSHVRVTDLSAGAPDDRTVSPTPAQVAAISHAALVVDVGDGYQPAVEGAIHQAATSHPPVLSLAPALKATDAQFWLNPPTMGKAAGLVAGALESVDPAYRSTYRQGATDVRDAMSALQIDFQSSLADCPHALLVAPDGAFATMAASDGLRLVPVGPSASPATMSRVANQIRTLALPTVYTEPPVADAALATLARTTHVAVHALDTLDGPPPGSPQANLTYTARMENNLSQIAGGLYCSSAGNS